MATCRLVDLLVDACRSVGVPAQAAGVATNGATTHGWKTMGRWRLGVVVTPRLIEDGSERRAAPAIGVGVWTASWIPMATSPRREPEGRAVGDEDVTTRYAPLREATESGSFVSVRVRQSPAANAWPVTVSDAFKNCGGQRTRAEQPT